MLQRIRHACKQGSFKLSNIVEVDETYIGGKENNKHANKKLNAGRGAVGKTAVFGMKERGGKVDTILSLVSIWQLPSFNLNTNSST
jgi:hypothetical protein